MSWSAVAQSVVEYRTRNRESPGSYPHGYHLEARAFSFSPRRPSSLSCVNEFLAIDGDGMGVNSLCALMAEWLNASQRSRVGVRMNRSARG